MFKVVLDKWVCKDAPTVRRFGYPRYLLDSVIEQSTALLRACNSCEMLKLSAWSPPISFIAGVTGPERGSVSDRAGELDKGSFPQDTLYARRATFISRMSAERPLLHPAHRSFRCSPVTGEWNEMGHHFAGISG